MTTLSDNTATGSSSTDGSSNHAKRQMDIDGITKKLRSNAPELNPTQLLLQRAQIYADLGNGASAQSDIAQAASLVKDSKHGTPENIAAVERAFRDISISSGSGRALSKNSYSDKQDSELVDVVAEMISSGSFSSDLVDILHTLEARGEQKKNALQSNLLTELVDIFHDMCSSDIKISDDQDQALKALVSCISSCFAVSATAQRSQANTGFLSVLLNTILGVWKKHESNGLFKQNACRYGAGMYASAVYALVSTSEIDADSELAH
ncbi:hypothetical protein LPJ57_009958, partial [Coemansia sp. RSA 486]